MRISQILFLVAACYLTGPLVPQRSVAEQAPAHARIPGIEASQLDAQLKGLVLFSELNCVACHQSTPSLASSAKKAPRLSAVGTRVNPYYLERFIQDPHRVKPGTTMPDVLSQLNDNEKAQAAKSITHYLVSLKNEPPFRPESIDAVAAELGAVLFHSVGCVACHSPRDEDGKEIHPATSVPLGALEKKYSVSSLIDFLRRPHAVRPSGRMPDMRLQGREIERIAHYLLQNTRIPGHLKYTTLRGKVTEGLDVNVEKEKSGFVEDFDLNNFGKLGHNTAVTFEGFIDIKDAGLYTFSFEMNGGQLSINDQQVVDLQPSSRREVRKVKGNAELIAGWNKVCFTYIHAGREPRLRFEMEGDNFKRSPIPTSMLSISDTPIAPYIPLQIDPSLVSLGKENFSRLGCANCHDDTDATPNSYPALAKLSVHSGCMSGKRGHWPQLNLSPTQKELLTAVLPDIGAVKLDDKQRIDTTLTTFNCIGCHDRAGLGGVSPQRNPYFTGQNKELGNEGRVPPPLTNVGAKLKKPWLAEVLLRGTKQRTYMDAHMPVFGENNVGHLTDLFEKVDSLEKVAFSEIGDVKAYKSAGHQIIGANGFACIACHDFNGQKAEGPGAMEIIHTTERIKKDWFYQFMLNPARFRPNIVMPSSWPGGHAFKKDLLDGDTKKQIESVWVYLEDGTRAKNPIGLSRKARQIRVADQTVMCRGRGSVAGYRGIAVGYPERVSLAFDSEEMNLRALWRGNFVSVNHGSFNIRGNDRIEFSAGIPFHRLKSLEDNWPYKRKTDYLFPQDHGYRYKGYFLDKKMRPTFRYNYGQIEVEDYSEDLLDANDRAYLKRTFTFETPAAQQPFYFRAGSGKVINHKTAGSYQIDRLTVDVHSVEPGIVRVGEPQELLIPLTLPQGKSTLVIEYHW